MVYKKILLEEKDIPKQWYNVLPDLPGSPRPPVGPDGKPISPEMLAAVALAREWETRAERALLEGQDMEARFAVERKLIYAQAVEALRDELAKQSETIAHLRSHAYELQVQIEAAQRQREIVHARHERQETEEQIRRAFGRRGSQQSHSSE